MNTGQASGPQPGSQSADRVALPLPTLTSTPGPKPGGCPGNQHRGSRGPRSGLGRASRKAWETPRLVRERPAVASQGSLVSLRRATQEITGWTFNGTGGLVETDTSRPANFTCRKPSGKRSTSEGSSG